MSLVKLVWLLSLWVLKPLLWVLKPSATTLPFCVALSPSVHWHWRFYIAVLSIIFSFLDFVSCYHALTGLQLLTWTADFHCFGALGVVPGARILPHVLAWYMGVIIAIVEPQRKSCKSAWPLFFLEFSKILENNGPLWGFFKPHPNYSYVEPRRKVKKVLGHCFSLNFPKYSKTMAHSEGFSNLTPIIAM